jgi:protein gp37
VPFFFKQWGEWTPGENVERVRGTVDTAFLCFDRWHISPLNLATDAGHIDDQPDLYRVGKKAAGRLLDGREWNGVPS